MVEADVTGPDGGSADASTVPTDQAKLERVAQAIAEGRYPIDFDQIAAKLIESNFAEDINPK